MYRFVILVAVVVVEAHPKFNEVSACGRVVRKCCKIEMPPMNLQKGAPSEDIRECFKLKNPSPCDFEKCIAKKQGKVSEDGTFDKKKMAEDVDQRYGSNPELADKFKENCINGDFSKYGSSDMCDLVKQKVCFEIQMIKSCEWSEEGDCRGMKELAAECVEQIFLKFSQQS